MEERLKLVCHAPFTLAVETGLVDASQGPVPDLPWQIFLANVTQSL